MHVVVLGAGITGLTTAWHLSEAGAEVTLIDRGPAPASETSHANGGHLSTSSAKPWTGPREVLEYLAHCGQRERTIRICHTSFPQFGPWARHALAAARPAAHRRNSATLLRLAAYSRECFDELVRDQHLDVALEISGTLAIYRHERTFRRARRRSTAQPLDTAEILAHEPALANARLRPAGALHHRGDATGDCQRFCEQLAERLEQRGAHLRWRSSAHDLHFEHGKLRAIVTDNGTLETDTCVVALGAEAARFMRAQRVRLPIVPLRGYTLTAALAATASAPGRFIDAERHLVFARLGNRFRAAGMADFAGLSRTAPASRLAQLERLTRDWYPDMATPEFWACLRPITPDGPPILGASGLPGVWLHTGLGPLGWTLACGTARLVADQILGRAPALNLDGLTRERFG
ncbi:MAG: FAD-dependent oxidoreductase [Gammaproteobacteria bacterium]